MVSGTTWESAEMDIALIALPTLVPIPFGINFQLHTFDDAITDEMCKISTKHGFWAKTMVDAIEQVKLNEDSTTIAERLISSIISSRARNHTRAATKGIREAKIATSGPFIKSSLAGRKHKAEQEIIKSFFRRNPTPARVEIHDDDNVTIPVVSTCVPAENIHPPPQLQTQKPYLH
jgi:hypothetical protein